MPQSLPPSHALFALAVVAIWGTNFPVITVATAEMPPLLVAALRFLLVFFPAALIVRRPAAPWRLVAAYGLLIGVGQFGVIYFAVGRYISPGLTSLVVQTQVFFTILLSVLIERERVALHQWTGLALGALGIVVLALNTGGDVTLLGLVLVLMAALFWSLGNMAGKAAGRVDMVGFMVWSSLFAFPPLVMLALIVDGQATLRASLVSANLATWAAVAWQAYGNALFGFGVWAFLLSRHPAALIVPTALLVPVFGMGASAVFLGESLPTWKLTAAALVIGGLTVNLLWPTLRRALLTDPSSAPR